MSDHQVTQCKGCNKTPVKGQGWHLRNYFGFTGSFCPKCYDMIRHDAYGRPRNPAKLTWMQLQMRG